ncbi:MAG: biopolymer transporter ExbD [Chloroflexota bacterium]
MRSFSDGARPITDINVTPLVDVALVLLVIFMAAAPLIHQKALHLTLPKATRPQSKPSPAVRLMMDSDRRISLEGRIIEPARLDSELAALLRQDPALKLSLAADESVPYGEVARMLDEARKAGVKSMSLEMRPK